ncbi:DUF1127 domain-containing protein [Agarivorans sp. MS3-6]|uniref:DUF1127 domain-containing protein n=1 Tax=Agarivorans sp. TSD2052 TaxID=2937286 RepID=UPI00200D2AC4|nr:DUF1127 domain-containing protein [Agarivorans sp. TSD2052]UPW19666.1 DUF1127 domain-containing protein [Agarivorans sp. TSD2052]
MNIINHCQGILSQLLQTAAIYRARRRSRQALLALSDDLLKDIGLTRAQAKAEGAKVFWQQRAASEKAKQDKLEQTANYTRRQRADNC